MNSRLDTKQKSPPAASGFPENISFKRRDGLKIVEDILSVAFNGASKTEVVYRANLNFNRYKNYVSLLLEKGLVTLTERGGIMTTERGRLFLELSRQRKEILTMLSP
ncbi:winged helix-turn-helix domain-containing protein [Candidatus Hecatella orcuttiae]|uniref:winged helix-turn-helix domain-containing protein n=1 Tax=Candidatus Hecatella orcuttiae TaxID=1935119 RepID=UPI002867BB75|nr:winged helix-turn-helix domain-containing protein [Candidatus Hecatella orcuttiae]